MKYVVIVLLLYPFYTKKLESVQFCVTIFDIINPFHEVYHEKKPMILENRMR